MDGEQGYVYTVEIFPRIKCATYTINEDLNGLDDVTNLGGMSELSIVAKGAPNLIKLGVISNLLY